MIKQEEEKIIKTNLELSSHFDKFEKDDTEMFLITFGDLKNNYAPLKIDLSKTEYSHFFKFIYTKIESDSSVNKGNVILEFYNCIFLSSFRLNDDLRNSLLNEIPITFKNCSFKNINFSNSNFNGGLRFIKCNFQDSLYFRYSVFNKQLEFLDCSFKSSVRMLKSNFNDLVNFSGTSFIENVFLSFSKFHSNIIFNHASFQSGLDISDAIFYSNISFFNVDIKNFKTLIFDKENRNRDSFIDDGIIPTINKKETFRIIKNQLLSINNNTEALKYESLEKTAFQQKLKEDNIKWYDKDRLIFIFNYWSNNHKSSWKQGVKFTFITSLFLYFIASISTFQFYFSIEGFLPNLYNHIKGFIYFLNPVHNPNFIIELFDLENSKICFLYYVFDYLGRVFVGYGIYQTIQAFRKFK